MEQELRRQEGMNLEAHKCCTGVGISIRQEQEQPFTKLGKAKSKEGRVEVDKW